MNDCAFLKQVECEKRIATLEENKNNVLLRLDEIKKLLVETIEKHDSRISAIEKWQMWVIGSAGMVGAFLYGAWDYVKGKL